MMLPEGDEDDDKEEEDGDDDNDNIQEETPKDEENEGEEDNEDDTQFINTDPVPPKCWTQSQQAQQDEHEYSLVKEILSDEEKQQKSQMEESALPSNDQPSSQGKGGEPVSKEAGLQDHGNEYKSAVQGGH